MNAELLLEIGTEEIPSGYLEKGLQELRLIADACLRENRIEVAGGLHTYGTPRRLVLTGMGISQKQKDLVKEVTGPPKRVAYDERGAPTKAALGFAEKQGVSVEDLGLIETPKGEYVYVKSQVPGRPTLDVLAESFPKLIADIPWPKSMCWGGVGFPFVRPIHWILCLLNGEVVPFEVAEVNSGNTTRGHRFMAPETMEISDVQDYFLRLGKAFVIVDQKERNRAVERVAKEAATTVEGTLSQDPELVSTVANLIEYPSAVCGGFDESFLAIPDPVLITAMKEHQKYFAIYDGKGQLMPNFVAVNNTVVRDESIVQKGHERVLRARLSDADFFFKEDRKRPLLDRLEDLKGVIYQAKLGTSFAKVERFTRLAEYLAEMVLPEKMDGVRLSARLCKCDLVTHMVTEFPTLQGVMGREYARMDGYPEEVCLGIYEHYLPLRSGGQLPTSKIGAIVGLADRMDTIVGCFAIGLEPSGSADPFALRRHALAVIRIIEDMGWDLPLLQFIQKSLSVLSEEMELDNAEVLTRVADFFRERYKNMMLGAGYESDQIEAVISLGLERINQLRERIDQLNRFASESDEFQELALTFKRVSNILKKQDALFEVNPSLFQEECESTLWEAYQSLEGDVHAYLDRGAYYEALEVMVGLRKPVDLFFDGVEVFTKDDKPLRENRVGILQHVAGLFMSVADLSKLSIPFSIPASSRF